MTCKPLDDRGSYDCVLIATDHSDYDFRATAEQSQLVIDTRNATAGLTGKNIVRC
jgi:UDP-N-acetyl-D-glucosamine dehydrogenase